MGKRERRDKREQLEMRGGWKKSNRFNKEHFSCFNRATLTIIVVLRHNGGAFFMVKIFFLSLDFFPFKLCVPATHTPRWPRR